MKLRLMQFLLLVPCLLSDVFVLFIVLIPLWIVLGQDLTSKESTSEWLFNLKNKE